MLLVMWGGSLAARRAVETCEGKVENLALEIAFWSVLKPRNSDN